MILVGMCTGGTIQSLTVMSLMELLGESGSPVSIQIGGYKPHGMNNLVKDAMEIKATHLLNIDSDMIFPPDSLEKLLKVDKDIVGANYRWRGNHMTQDAPQSTVRFIGNEKNGFKTVLEEDFPKVPFKAGAVGLGLCLINMKVFEKMPFPWFHTIENETHQTEDIVFCIEARKKGFEVWCDPTLKLKHIGNYLY